MRQIRRPEVCSDTYQSDLNTSIHSAREALMSPPSLGVLVLTQSEGSPLKTDHEFFLISIKQPIFLISIKLNQLEI